WSRGHDSSDGHRPPLQLHPFRDFYRKLERCSCLETRNTRLTTGGRAFDEGNELMLKRFAALDPNSVVRYLSGLATINFAALFFVIEGEISILLKDTNFTHALGTNATGGDIRDAPVFKTNPRIGNVFATTENRNTNGIDVLRG